jgi:hypothetical protein
MAKRKRKKSPPPPAVLVMPDGRELDIANKSEGKFQELLLELTSTEKGKEFFAGVRVGLLERTVPLVCGLSN